MADFQITPIVCLKTILGIILIVHLYKARKETSGNHL